MTLQRRRVRPALSFKDRLVLWSEKLRNEAGKLRPGPQRDEMLKRASLADTAAHIDDWANSRGLRPPT
jgi:hypothetical protein